MSEQHPSPEQGHEALPTPEHHEAIRHKREQHKQAEHEPGLTAHEARAAVAEVTTANKAPNPLEKLRTAEKSPQHSTPQHINRELKSITLQRELSHIRRRLPAMQRSFSKVIHQPAVRAVSEVASRTVSRPSGLLGGGLLACFGSGGYLYLAKHIGFTYNYGVAMLLFAAGFILGVILELSLHLVLRRRHD